MTLTPEEALRALCKFSADIDRTAQLASLGYALHPIKIDEAAVQHAMEAYNIYPSMDHGLSMKAAITAYHEALFSRARGEKEGG